MIRPTNGETEHVDTPAVDPDTAHSVPPEEKGDSWPVWADAFLEGYKVNGIVAEAVRFCEETGRFKKFNRRAIYHLRQRSPSFAEAMDDAKEDARDKARSEVAARAMGEAPSAKPDTLLMFHTKALCPEYRDKGNEYHTHVQMPAAEKELRFS